MRRTKGLDSDGTADHRATTHGRPPLKSLNHFWSKNIFLFRFLKHLSQQYINKAIEMSCNKNKKGRPCNQGKGSCPDRTGNYKTWRAILIAAQDGCFPRSKKATMIHQLRGYFHLNFKGRHHGRDDVKLSPENQKNGGQTVN